MCRPPVSGVLHGGCFHLVRSVRSPCEALSLAGTAGSRVAVVGYLEGCGRTLNGTLHGGRLLNVGYRVAQRGGKSKRSTRIKSLDGAGLDLELNAAPSAWFFRHFT